MPVPQYARSCSDQYRSRLVPGSLFAANMICVEILLNDLHVFEVYGHIDALRCLYPLFTVFMLCNTSGCQFGEGCHFLDYVPGGFSALGQMGNMGPGARKPAPPTYADGPAPAIKTKLCNQINTPEGCKFGNKCRFAHSILRLY